MSGKVFVQPDQLIRDAFRLARSIYESGYRPDVILVLWRGGTPVGIVVHEFLLFKGIDTDHTAVKATSYAGIGRHVEPRIEHMDCVLRQIRPDSRVLVVDDIFDTGCTLRKILELLRTKTPHVKMATLYYKPDSNQTDLHPDFFCRKTDRWVVFPHELVGLTEEEIAKKTPYLADVVLDDGSPGTHAAG